MAQDRSRSAFDVRIPKHWSSLQAQQGRLISDDDWNEADAIVQDDTRHMRAHVIGPAGSPDAGFKLDNPTLSANQIDFDLLPGTLYAGGLRATLEQKEKFSLQRDWLQQPASERPPLGNGERFDLAYLEVWQQPVTAIEDAELQEIALGVPDTSVRIRTMRRVHLQANVGTDNCAKAWSSLVNSLGGLSSDNELNVNARLSVGPAPNGGPAQDLCAPAVQGGYLGAENQAIRVELRAGNKFTWGFDNASPLYRVQVTHDAQAAEVIVFLTPPRDEVHWPLSGQIVELLPWSALLPNGEKVAENRAGMLSRVTASYDPNTQTIQLADAVGAFGSAWQARADAATLGTAASAFVYLRVWNRGADLASPPEIPFTPGTAVQLAGTGLQVSFSGTNLRPGDFWILAARPSSPARVVPWSFEDGRLAEGVRRFYAPLGIIHWKPGAAATLFDCRDTFSPLTRPRGCCVTLSPVSGWEHSLDALAADDDLCLCFQPGDYATSRTLVLRNKRVKLHGAGAASRVRGVGVENVFLFDGCSSVEIRELSVEATAQLQPGAGAPKPHLAGAITVRNADRVRVVDVRARCASGPVCSAACIALYNEVGERARAASASVAGCELITGANQIGLSIVNFGSASVQNNQLHVDATENASLPSAWLQLKAYRVTFRKALLYRHGMGADRPAGAIALKLGSTDAWVQTANELASSWPSVVALRKFNSAKASPLTVSEFLEELAGDLVYGSGSIGTRSFPAFKNYISAVLALRTADSHVRTIAAQGIVVAGTIGAELRVQGNSVRDFTQGIHVGFSQARARGPASGAPDSAGRVVISDNCIYITLMPESVVERHGIFVGNCQSLVIEDNQLTCEALGSARRLAIEGIRVYGFLGRMAYITRNHIAGFPTGVRFAGLNNKADGSTSLWRVNENIAFGAQKTVDNALKVGTTTQVVISGNKP